MKKILIAISVLLAGYAGAFAQAGIQEFDNSGSVAAKYLDLGSGAAASGMGNAYIGVAVDAGSIFWNPAGLANMQRNDKNWNVYFSENIWLLGVMDSMVSDIAAAKYIKKIGTFGLGITYYNAGKIERSGIDTLGNPVPSGETYSPYALAVNAAYASILEEGINFAFNLKYLLDVIDGDAAHALAFDIGIRYYFPFLKDLSLNIVAKNFGGRLNKNMLAKEMSFAAAYMVAIGDFKITADYDVCGKISNYPLHRIGIEIKTPYIVTARAGYQMDNTTVTEGFKNFNFGLGLNFSDKYVDVSFEPYGDIGNTYKLSLGGDF
jgi:hypothetical protein